jgi:hypothetical protein
MSRFIGGFLVVSLFASTPVWAQGTPDTGAQSQGPQTEGTVQVGAGTKGDVTPGASGPQKGAGEGIEPASVTFEIRPPVDPLYGPGSLAIEAPQALRCEIIGHPATRQRCEQQASKNGVN